MNKALLIIKAPVACNKCEFYLQTCLFSEQLHGVCKITNEYIDPEEVCIKRSDKCPLKPMPERRYALQGMKGYSTTVKVCKGWNDCIYEMLGEENESDNDS